MFELAPTVCNRLAMKGDCSDLLKETMLANLYYLSQINTKVTREAKMRDPHFRQLSETKNGLGTCNFFLLDHEHGAPKQEPGE